MEGGSVEKIEMIRCFVGRADQPQNQVRFIPADIFEMWRFLMERVHHLVVARPGVSVWVAEDQGEAALALRPLEPVVEIRFRYHDMGEVGRQVVRYFPEDEFDEVFTAFRRHFPDDERMHELSRRRGFFLAGERCRPLVEA